MSIGKYLFFNFIVIKNSDYIKPYKKNNNLKNLLDKSLFSYYTRPMKTITLEYDEAKSTVKTKADQAVTFEEYLVILANSILSFCDMILTQAPEDKKAFLKNALYDDINIAASNVLRKLAPELELRPGLTEDAILEAEDNIIKRHTAEELHEKYD